MKSFLIFPLAALLNSFSMTALLIVFGIIGYPSMAADIGLVQSATLALFYAFSANARNLILADTNGAAAIRLLQARLLMIVPLGVAAYLLSVELASVAAPLAVVLIVRRICEWIGEIGLARHERMHQPVFAIHTSALECITFSLSVLLPILFQWSLAASAIPWAFAPLLAARGAKLTVRSDVSHFSLRSLLPHFGSTSIIGTSAYIFRLSITLLAGKALAGDLFTAFAIGGLIPTVYGQALAPTLAYRFGESGLPRRILSIPTAIFLASVGLSIVVLSQPGWLVELGRSPIFWLATSLSVGGGAIMTIAVALRTRLIQSAGGGQEIFGPDLLANVLIATSVPFVFYVSGPTSLAWLYVLSSCLSLAFFLGAGMEKKLDGRWLAFALWVIGLLLLTPIFFQLDGHLFKDPAFVFEAGGNIFRLPLPISIFGLFGGIALLANYASSIRTLTVLFFTALLFVAASLVAAQGNSTYEGAKLILLAQFLLPMFGLVLGQMYGAASDKPFFEIVALATLIMIIPSQLIASWIHNYTILMPHVFFFSIYQHLQYFPMIVVALTIIVASASSQNTGNLKIVADLLVPIAGIYVIASHSILAIVALPFGLIALRCLQHKQERFQIKNYTTIIAMLVAMFAYGALEQAAGRNRAKDMGFSISENQYQILSDKLALEQAGAHGIVKPIGVTERIDHWVFYGRGLIESIQDFIFGHASPPDRNIHPSAHNYWLDALYNFGALALAPLFALLLWTLSTLWKWRSRVIASPLLLGVAMATTYLLLCENMLKVGMRQPYPGIITFFIWGLLIARLDALTRQPGAAPTPL